MADKPAKKTSAKPKKSPVKKTTSSAKKAAATTKKPLKAKTASKSVASKSKAKDAKVLPEKSTSKKSVSASSSTQKAVKKPISALEKIRSLHITGFITYVVLAVLTILLAGKAATEVFLSFQARDEFMPGDSVILGSAQEVLFSVEYRYILGAVLIIGGLGSLLLASKFWRRYESTVKAGVSGLRWILFGISGALLLEMASLMVGVQDLMTLKVIAGLFLAGSVLAWLGERENLGSKSPKKVAFYGSAFAFVFSLMPLIGGILGTLLFTTERYGWHVYAFSALMLVSILALIVLQASAIKNKSRLEYVVFEQRYIRLDQLTKFLAVLIFFAAIK